MINIKVIPLTCLLLSPILILVIPITAPSIITVSTSYALDYAGGILKPHGLEKYDLITFVTFYTYFKRGINPDCIDMVQDEEEL